MLGNLAQQLAAEPLITPFPVSSHQLKAPQFIGKEETAAGNQLIIQPDPPPVTQVIGDHCLIELSAGVKVGEITLL